MSNLSSDSTPVSAFAEIVTGFADKVANNFSQPVSAQPEDQLKFPVGELLRAAGELTGLEVNVFSREELPSPSDEERQPPRNIASGGEQLGLLAEETD